jgi:hypothetical protein
MSQARCPNCGMQQTEWLGSDREGFLKEGRTYCCQGCADGGASGCTCRVANPGVEMRGEGADADLLMTPRDRNGRPLSPEEVAAREARGEIVQLDETTGKRPAPPAENPRTATTN